MTGNDSQKTQSNELNRLDLSGLQNLDLGPRWGSGDLSKVSTPKEKHERAPRGSERTERRNDGERRPHTERKPQTDRRLFQKSKTSPERTPSARTFSPRNSSAHSPAAARKPFRPPFEILIYPNDAVFGALTKAMHASIITYQLFEVATLLLAKADRFVVVLKPKAASQPGQEAPKVYSSVPDRMPFATEEEAIQHVLKKHFEQFFDISEVEVEAPKGNFQCVCRCGITGIVLGPPNYHKYQQILQQHHRQSCSQMPFDRFQAKVETVKEKEAIDAWIESMKKETHYTLKEVPEGETPKMFDHFEAARLYLLTHLKDKAVRQVDTVRLEGKDIESLPEGLIKRSILHVWEFQKRFPLETANNLRGRLRRINFHLYKKGTRGVSYVCAVKRKFRAPETVFAQSIQDVINWIEKNPGIKRFELPFRLLGFELPQHEATTTPAQHPVEHALNAEAESPATTEETPHAATAHYTEEQQAQIKQVLMDLRWLVSEGYVIEYSDTALHAVPILVQGKSADKSEEGTEETETAEEAKESEAVESVEEQTHVAESVVGSTQEVTPVAESAIESEKITE